MFEYKGFKIQMIESPGVRVGDSFQLSNGKKLVHGAVSLAGHSFARTPQEALEGAKALIDLRVK